MYHCHGLILSAYLISTGSTHALQMTRGDPDNPSLSGPVSLYFVQRSSPTLDELQSRNAATRHSDIANWKLKHLKVLAVIILQTVPLRDVTRRKQQRPGIASNNSTTHVPTARSSADPTKPNHTPTRHTHA